MKITSRWDSEKVLFECECTTTLDCVMAAIKAKANFGGANFRDANFGGADLGAPNTKMTKS
ncbi:hypothetical protein FACS1894186_5830 [Alphaproteobacteria bacterium]|nr:hypothetical protein FACS1894186_5830 [Alphaproteobacteria bacterium]